MIYSFVFGFICNQYINIKKHLLKKVTLKVQFQNYTKKFDTLQKTRFFNLVFNEVH